MARGTAFSGKGVFSFPQAMIESFFRDSRVAIIAVAPCVSVVQPQWIESLVRFLAVDLHQPAFRHDDDGNEEEHLQDNWRHLPDPLQRSVPLVNIALNE